jgi:general L-amino acid transport system substrate-binding protein
VIDSQGVNRGLDADTCRAVAAAILGDANKVRWVVLSSQARLPALQSGQVDLLSRTLSITHIVVLSRYLCHGRCREDASIRAI